MSFSAVWSIFRRTTLNEGRHCGQTYYSHLQFTHLGVLQCLSVGNNNAVFLESESLQGLFCRLFICSWEAAPATNAGRLSGGHTATLRHLLYKDCRSLDREKPILVRGGRSSPRAELRSAHRAPRWPSLCERWTAEELRKCQVSYEFEWWLFLVMT